MKTNKQGPKVLVLDIETSPILASVWDIWEQNIPLNMIEKDWHILSWAAKWLGNKEIMYMDQRDAKNIEDDSAILKAVWKLLDEADVVIGQNSKAFDIKKLNARFIMNNMSPPSPFQQIDTKVIASRHFKFTSNKLEYMSEKLCVKKKSKHKKFSGFDLWKECIKGNKAAWDEMMHYNKQDVASTEDLYNRLQPWDNTINFSVFYDKETCNCGSTSFTKEGYKHTKTGKFQRYKCKNCATHRQGKVNLLSKEKKANLSK